MVQEDLFFSSFLVDLLFELTRILLFKRGNFQCNQLKSQKDKKKKKNLKYGTTSTKTKFVEKKKNLFSLFLSRRAVVPDSVDERQGP